MSWPSRRRTWRPAAGGDFVPGRERALSADTGSGGWGTATGQEVSAGRARNEAGRVLWGLAVESLGHLAKKPGPISGQWKSPQ